MKSFIRKHQHRRRNYSLGISHSISIIKPPIQFKDVYKSCSSFLSQSASRSSLFQNTYIKKRESIKKIDHIHKVKPDKMRSFAEQIGNKMGTKRSGNQYRAKTIKNFKCFEGMETKKMQAKKNKKPEKTGKMKAFLSLPVSYLTSRAEKDLECERKVFMLRFKQK